jgi:hypothetical protein
MGVDLLEELDAPDESFVDATSATLHFCPAGGAMDAADPLTLTLGASAVVVAPATGRAAAPATPADYAHGAGARLLAAEASPPIAFVTLTGFTPSHSRVAGLDARNVAQCAFDGLAVVAHGALGVRLNAANATTLSDTRVASVGCVGVDLTGGFSDTLEPAGAAVVGANITDFARITRTYAPGVAWSGVGLRVEASEISDGPHSGILGGGRDNVFTDNRFEDMLNLGITFDARGLGWQKAACAYNATDPADSGLLVLDLFAVHYQEPPYSTRYPRLPGLLEDRPCTPVGNVIANNTWCRAAKGFVDTNATRAASWGSFEEGNEEVC